MSAPLAIMEIPRIILANPVSLIVIHAQIVHPVIIVKAIFILIKAIAFYAV